MIQTVPEQPITPVSIGNPSDAPEGNSTHTAEDHPGGWTQETLGDPHANPEKAQRVQAMFAAIARSYDLNNHLHSLWIDHLWRRAAVKAAKVQPGERVIDLACGTGDLTQSFAKHTMASSIIGIDFTPQMLDFARLKQARLPAHMAERIEYRQGDAMDLDLPSAHADVVSIAFGLRNVQLPEKAIAEFYRILKPNGRLVILEFDQPRLAPVRWFNRLYCEQIMPRTATLIARDRSGAYRYLPKSVAAFRTREEVLAMLAAAGFRNGVAKPLSMGLCACYRATKPAS
jgi:demethylmenaquinone methyltransferase / 2-methoxy-6-polyprenyl-1,4-benzoquinol methylase